jgi:hypothetical protein
MKDKRLLIFVGLAFALLVVLGAAMIHATITVFPDDSGQTVINATPGSNFSLLTCVAIIQVSINTVSANNSNVSVDGVPYLLQPGDVQYLSDIGIAPGCSMQLINITNVTDPTLHTTQRSDSLLFFTNDSGSDDVTFLNQSINLSIQSSPLEIINVSPSNFSRIVTLNNVSSTPPAPAGFSKLAIVNIYLNESSLNMTETNNSITNITTINVTQRFKCNNSPNIDPFVLENNTWNPLGSFSLNTSGCSIMYPLQVSGINSITVALMNSTPAPAVQLEQPSVSSQSGTQSQNTVTTTERNTLTPIIILVGIMGLVGGAYASTRIKAKAQTKKGKAKR